MFHVLSLTAAEHARHEGTGRTLLNSFTCAKNSWRYGWRNLARVPKNHDYINCYNVEKLNLVIFRVSFSVEMLYHFILPLLCPCQFYYWPLKHLTGSGHPPSGFPIEKNKIEVNLDLVCLKYTAPSVPLLVEDDNIATPGTGFLCIKLKIQDSLAPYFKNISQQSHSSCHPSVPPFDHLFIYFLFRYVLALPCVPGTALDAGAAPEV